MVRLNWKIKFQTDNDFLNLLFPQIPVEISLTIWHHEIDDEELQTLSAGRDEYRVWEPFVKFGENPYTDYK